MEEPLATLDQAMIRRGVSTRLSTVALSMAASKFSFDMEQLQQTSEAVLVLCALAIVAIGASANAKQNVGAPNFVDVMSLFLIGASLAPVFGTLTLSYADNTVTTMTYMAYLIHLYSMDNRSDVAHAWASPVSLNAAFASTLLQASRLKSSSLSFTYTLLATVLLVFIPATSISTEMDFGLAGLAAGFTLVCFGWMRALLFVIVFLTVAIAGPLALKRIPREKINGPWDVLQVPEEDEL